MKSLKSAQPPFSRASWQIVMSSSPPLLSLCITTVVRPSEASPSTLTKAPWMVTMRLATPRPTHRTAKGLPVLLAALLAALLAVLQMMMATMTSFTMTRRTESCHSSQEQSPPSLAPPPPPTNPPNPSIGLRSANLTSLTVPTLINSIRSSCNVS